MGGPPASGNMNLLIKQKISRKLSSTQNNPMFAFGMGLNGAVGVGGPGAQENISDWTSSIKFKKTGFIKTMNALYLGTEEEKAALIFNM